MNLEEGLLDFAVNKFFLGKIMKIKSLHISYSKFSGAGHAAARFYEYFVVNNGPSEFISYDNLSYWPRLFAIIRQRLDKIPFRRYTKNIWQDFSTQWLSNKDLVSIINNRNPDIVHLHWICFGMLSINDLMKIEKPIVWTMHDMWPFTGGCHYAGQCLKYQQRCGACPQLDSIKGKDLSRWVWERKDKAWENLNISFIAPSHWLARQAEVSSLLKDKKITVIHNGIDTQTYHPQPCIEARKRFNLPQDKKIILAGALNFSDARKGVDLLLDALKISKPSDVALAVFGDGQKEIFHDSPCGVHVLGRLNNDQDMMAAYNAADVAVFSSREDNLPNTVLESLSCGTPVVAFNIGGIPEMIRHQENGYLARALDAADLAHGVDWVLSLDKDFYKKLSQNARQMALEEFNIEKQAAQYLQFYDKVLSV